MAKSSRGGQRGKGTGIGVSSSAKSSNSTQPVVASTDKDLTPKVGKDYRDFLKMSEDERIDAIAQAITEDVPVHLSDSSFQRVVYNLEFNDKPEVVDDKTLDKMNGTEMFRTVNSVYNGTRDLYYSPSDIIDQIQNGSTTRTSDSGGSAFGRGIYYATSYRESTDYYGRVRNDITKTAVTRAKLNANAKIMSYSSATQGARSEINSGTKLGRMLARCDSHSQSSIYALVKGYNVIDNGSGYIVVLNRSATTMSKDIRPAHSYGKGW
jgi:hypothetical protein